MGNSFETITVLQYRLKAAQEELAAFQSGEKYIRMEKQHLTQVRALERRIAKLEAAVAKEHSHAITIRNQWFEIFEQLQKECDRMVAETLKLIHPVFKIYRPQKNIQQPRKDRKETRWTARTQGALQKETPPDKGNLSSCTRRSTP